MTPERFDELRQHTAVEPYGAGELNECLDEIARLASLVYVPGTFKCPKCGFAVVKSVLYVKSGSIGADHHCSEPCPNDGTKLEPVTWESEARQMAKLMPELARLRNLERVMSHKPGGWGEGK